MKYIAQVVSFLGLGATATGPLLYFYDQLTLGQTQIWLLVGALVWFLTAPLWMEHKA